MSFEEEAERCRPWLEAALKYASGTHDYDDIVQAIREGRMQLWSGRDAAAVTEIVLYPKMKILNFFLAGGDLDEILERLEAATQWGREQGCTRVMMTGRKGWEKVLAKHGWKPRLSVMDREIA